jgi:P pilus assembly chaperone PapD
MRPPQPIAQFLSMRPIKFLATMIALFASVVLASGTAAAQLTASPTGLRFGTIVIGQSDTMPVTLINSGSSSVTISGISSNIVGFKITNLTLPYTLAAGASVSINVTFTPTVKGFDGEAITFASNASNKTLTLLVAGVGVTSESLIPSPASLSFGNVAVGASSTLPVVLTNSGSTYVVFAQAQTSGTGYTVSGTTLPVALAPKQSLTLNVTFTPKSAGASSGSIVSPNGGLSLPLSGTGTSTSAGQLVPAPSSLSFGNVNVGSTETQPLTLSASGASVTIASAASSSSQFMLQGATFPVTLAAGQSVTYNVAFTPNSNGSTAGSLSFSSNASTSQTLESMSGVGTTQQYNVSLSWTPSTSQVVGYNVYRWVTQGTYSKINSTLNPSSAYTDNTVASGQTYYYAATAVDSTGTESSYSTPITAVIP